MTLKGSERTVACWLHSGEPDVRVPVELTREVRTAPVIQSDQS
jgi:hypothetical protein